MDGVLDNLDPLIVLVVSGGTVLPVWVAVRRVDNAPGRILLIGFALGLLFFNGIGAAHPNVGLAYLVTYFGFLLAFLGAFRWFSDLFRPLGRQVERVLTDPLARIETGRYWCWVVPAYLGLHLVPLIYPQWRLGSLWAPGGPDLTSHFEARFADEPLDVILKLVNYGQLLLTPFFFMALYRYRQRMAVVGGLLLGLGYLKYVSATYLGRSTMVQYLGILGFALWLERPRWRWGIVAGGLALAPLFLIFSYVWGVVRLGGNTEGVGFGEAVATVVAGQIRFPMAGITVIESQERANLSDYLTWIVTLPLPKVLIGEVDGARINYEIAEVLLGVPAGWPGFHVTLAGVVAESVYLYGRDFFWLHGLALGMLAALVMRLLDRPVQLRLLQGFAIMLLTYALCRGGVSSLLPPLVNHLLGFYLLVLALFWNGRERGAKQPDPNRYAQARIGR